TRLTPPPDSVPASPPAPTRDLVVSPPGAGGTATGALLVAIAEVFCDAGYFVLRCDLPFRQNRPSGPPRPADAKWDREGLKNAVAIMRRRLSKRLFLGGQSYGGRQATMLCADEPELADGLLLTSYPLHPPGKREQLRTQHFPGLRTPALFVEGSKDPFATLKEIGEALKLIPAPTRVLPFEGVGHDLGFRGKPGAESAAKILAAFQDFFH